MLSNEELNFVPSQTTLERPSAGADISAAANLAPSAVGKSQGPAQER